jgi:hypothetical protein
MKRVLTPKIKKPFKIFGHPARSCTRFELNGEKNFKSTLNPPSAASTNEQPPGCH